MARSNSNEFPTEQEFLSLIWENTEGIAGKTMDSASSYATTLFALLPHDVRNYLCRSPRYSRAFEQPFHLPLRDFDISLIAPAPDVKTAPIVLPRFVYLRKPGSDGNFEEPMLWNESPYYGKFVSTADKFTRDTLQPIDQRSLGFMPAAILSKNAIYLIRIHFGLDGHPLPIFEFHGINYSVINSDGTPNTTFSAGTIPAGASISPNSDPMFFLNMYALCKYIEAIEQMIKEEHPESYVKDEARGPANFFGSLRLFKPVDEDSTSWESHSNAKSRCCTLKSYHDKFSSWASTNGLKLCESVEWEGYYELSSKHDELRKIDAEGIPAQMNHRSKMDEDSDNDEEEDTTPLATLLPIVTTVRKAATPRRTPNKLQQQRTTLVFLGKSKPQSANIPEGIKAAADVDPENQGDDEDAPMPPVSVVIETPMELEILNQEAEASLAEMVADNKTTAVGQKRQRPSSLEDQAEENASPRKKRRTSSGRSAASRFVNMPVRSEPEGPQAIVVIHDSSSDEESTSAISSEFVKEATEPVLVASPVMYEIDQTPLISHSLNARPVEVGPLNPEESSPTVRALMFRLEQMEQRLTRQEKRNECLEQGLDLVKDELQRVTQSNGSVADVKEALQKLSDSVSKMTTEMSDANSDLQQRVDNLQNEIGEMDKLGNKQQEQAPAFDVDKAMAALEAKMKSHLDGLSLNQNAILSAQHQVTDQSNALKESASRMAEIHKQIQTYVAPFGSMAQQYGARLIKLEQDLAVLFNLLSTPPATPTPGPAAGTLPLTTMSAPVSPPVHQSASMYNFLPTSDSVPFQ